MSSQPRKPVLFACRQCRASKRRVRHAPGDVGLIADTFDSAMVSNHNAHIVNERRKNVNMRTRKKLESISPPFTAAKLMELTRWTDESIGMRTMLSPSRTKFRLC